MSKPRTYCCSAHCRSCNTHFGSDAAFDRHRVGEHGLRACKDPEEVIRKDGSPWFENVEGDCRVTENLLSDVLVWREAGSAEKVRGAFAQREEKGLGA